MKPSEQKKRLAEIRRNLLNDGWYEEREDADDIEFLLDLVDELLVLQDIVSDHVEDRGLKEVLKECLEIFQEHLRVPPDSLVEKLKILVGEHK